MFYMRLTDGIWGEQIAELNVLGQKKDGQVQRGQKLNVLVSTQEQNLGFIGNECSECDTHNSYNTHDKES